MPRAATSSSLSPGILSQCRPFNVADSEMTREIGREFEFPKTWTYKHWTKQQSARLTPIAVTKLEGLFPRRNPFETATETAYDTVV